MRFTSLVALVGLLPAMALAQEASVEGAVGLVNEKMAARVTAKRVSWQGRWNVGDDCYLNVGDHVEGIAVTSKGVLVKQMLQFTGPDTTRCPADILITVPRPTFDAWVKGREEAERAAKAKKADKKSQV